MKITMRSPLTATVALGCQACFSTALIEVPVEVRVCPVHAKIEVGVSAEEVQAWSRAHRIPTIALA